MHDWSSLSNVRWDCKYHIVFVPKYRKKKLYGKFRKRVSGLHFWARGYCISTVGLDEETIRNYIREQEKSEQEQLELEFDEE